MTRILYFGSFDKPFDTEVYVANTFESLGHEVVRKQPTKTTITELKELLKEKFDFILLSKGWFEDEETATRLIKESGIKTVGWFWDLCWNTPREWLLKDHHLFKADYVFTTDGGDWDWSKYNINHSVIRQGIYEPEAIEGKVKKEYEYDVVFVGTNCHKAEFDWNHRGDLLNFLKKYYGSRFKHFGTDDGIRNLDLNDVYASAKVVVGDSVDSPFYWSNRVYETIGRNGFLVFPKVEGIETEFTPYKHFIPYEYSNFEQLAEIVDYYIAHKEERDKIRKAGFEYCKEHHTYTHRCQKLLDYLKDNG